MLDGGTGTAQDEIVNAGAGSAHLDAAPVVEQPGTFDTGQAAPDAARDSGTPADGADASLDAAAPEADALEGDATSNTDAELEAATLDADAPDSGGEDGDAGICGASLSTASGCADGVRRGLTSATRHPDIAVCAGSWEGDVSNGSVLCAAGFHVCTGAEQALRAVTFEEARCFLGCYAFDAAQDNYQCLPDCSSRVGSIDSAERLDMGAMGSGCPYQFPGANSCLSGGRIDGSENDGIGCNYNARFSGVVCCKN
jgi:hypothetical protein